MAKSMSFKPHSPSTAAGSRQAGQLATAQAGWQAGAMAAQTGVAGVRHPSQTI